VQDDGIGANQAHKKGSKGTTLSKVDNLVEGIDLLIDRRSLLKGINVNTARYEIRQEIDIPISRFINE
jgi:hypothetical protein